MYRLLANGVYLLFITESTRDPNGVGAKGGGNSTSSGRSSQRVPDARRCRKELRGIRHRRGRRLVDRLGPDRNVALVCCIGSSLMITVFANARIFDGISEDLAEGFHVVVESGKIREVTPTRPSFHEASVIDCRGRFLMPGLIDAHFHAYSPSFDIAGIERMPASLLASHAGRILEGALERGFTTVRDAGGGDIGLWVAIEQGLIRGPRFFFAGRALSQTGGHGDMRRGNEVQPCGCTAYSGRLSRVVDGVDEVRRAAREELLKGAHQVKIFVSGGVLSPTDPLWMPQFTAEEITAVVEEAAGRRTYVMAHCHTDEGAARCAELGVRSIEHGTLIYREETARLIAARDRFVVPRSR